MTTEPVPEETESPLDTAAEGARGHGARWLVWALGCLLAVIGAATTIQESFRHHQSFGPYLLAAGFFLLFLAALDMWRVERSRARRDTRTVRRLVARTKLLEDNREHLEHNRDQWRRMQAEEASINRRLTDELRRVQQARVSVATEDGAPTSQPVPRIGAGEENPTPPSSAPVQRSRPRHQVRRPAANQPALFDQDDAAR